LSNSDGWDHSAPDRSIRPTQAMQANRCSHLVGTTFTGPFLGSAHQPPTYWNLASVGSILHPHPSHLAGTFMGVSLSWWLGDRGVVASWRRGGFPVQLCVDRGDSPHAYANPY
jgi:hypothetical protein